MTEPMRNPQYNYDRPRPSRDGKRSHSAKMRCKTRRKQRHLKFQSR